MHVQFFSHFQKYFNLPLLFIRSRTCFTDIHRKIVNYDSSKNQNTHARTTKLPLNKSNNWNWLQINGIYLLNSDLKSIGYWRHITQLYFSRYSKELSLYITIICRSLRWRNQCIILCNYLGKHRWWNLTCIVWYIRMHYLNLYRDSMIIKIFKAIIDVLANGQNL